MELSTRGRYAVMALVDLAAREGEAPERGAPERGVPARPVTLAEIAARQQLSLSYLEQLFGKLRRAGIVASVRGPGGGYRLAKPTASLPIADIVNAVDEPIRVTRCREGGPGCLLDCDGAPMRCRTHDLWHELSRQIHLFLSAVTLADVIEGKVAGRATQLADDMPAPLAAD
jgi:Rrf2 family iron-sulfur cluster assembly transcriptional regulator